MITKAKISKERYKTEVQTGNHHLVVDEPESAGGKDLGPTPIQLLEAAIASCSTITMRMYADRKGWDVEDIEVSVEYRKDPHSRESIMAKNIEIKGNLEDKQIQRLIEIGGRCPVIKLVADNVKIVHVTD